MLQDIRFAARQSGKSPAFSIAAVLTLALAIGANTTIFSLVDALLLHPLPYPNPGRLMVVTENLPHYNLVGLQPSFSEFLEYRALETCFSNIAAVTGAHVTLTGAGQPETVSAKRITAAAFPMLGIKPLLGVPFMHDNEQYGNHHAVILSEGLWRRRYGGDPAIIGKYIHIDRESYRVAAVIRPLVDALLKSDLWLPLALPPVESAPGVSGPHDVDVIGYLNPGMTIEQARHDFSRIASRMVELHPNQDKKYLGFSIDVNPLAEQEVGDLRKPLYVLIAVVGAVLLIACANVSNLLLARGTMRRKEIGLRLALGASRGRIVRQLLTESLLLAGVGAAGGVLLTFLGLHVALRFAPDNLIPGTQPALNAWVIAFSLLMSSAASVLFGLAPAIETSGVSVNEALKERSCPSSGGKRILRESIVAFEIAASFILLIAAGLLVRSFAKLEHESPGFQSANVLLAIVPLPIADYPPPAQRIAFERTLLERTRALPGIVSAAASDFPPFAGGVGSHIEIVGQPQSSSKSTEVVYQTFSSSGYLETLQIPLLKGRRLSSRDDLSSLPVCDIDQTVASKFFRNSEPLGVQVLLPVPRITCTVVGVVGATKSRSLSRMPLPRIYYSSVIPVPQITLVIKTVRDPSMLVPALHHELLTMNPNLPLSAMTLDRFLADSLAQQRFSTQLVAIFAIIAMLLAVIGIYGVLACSVNQRLQEFGIRMALGAQPADVMGLVLMRGSIPVGVGLACGIAGAFGTTRYLKSLLHEVSSTDPAVFKSILLCLAVVSVLAMLLPAYRATRVDPLESLREE